MVGRLPLWIPLLLGLAALAAVASPIPTAVGPQALTAQRPPDDTLEVQIVRRVIHERWIHEDRQADFVPWQEATETVVLRQIIPGLDRSTGSRFWDATIGRTDADVLLDSVGRFRSLGVRPPPIRYSGARDISGVRRSRIRRLQGEMEVLRLPSSRFRDLWLPLPTTSLTAGETWTDTVSFTAEPGEGLRESYHAIRHHRVMGDTVINGRTAPWIRTEAEVRYQASHLEVLLVEVRTIERELTGRTVAVMAVDTATGLRLAGVDTSRWEGRAVLHDTVSGPFTSDVRFEGTQTWTWYAAPSYQAFQDSARAARRRGRTGMLILPTAEVEERLAAGDSLLADSLLARWRQTPDPAEARRISRHLRFFAQTADWTRERLDSLEFDIALERGDTAAALAVARRHIPRSGQLTLEEAELLLPYLDDPERLWRLGVPARFDYSELTGSLLRASPLLEPDTTRWGCEPRACQLFLDQLETTSEPRLRDAALVGAFARDPVRWYDRLLTREAAGSGLVAEAVRFARGVPAPGSTPFMREASEEVAPAVPGPGAGWEAWRAWWRAGRGSSGEHRYALRLYEARTGRDPLAELVADWPPAGDSAQVHLGEILRSLGALPRRSAEELRTELLSGDPGRIRRAGADVRGHIARDGAEMDPREVAALLPPLLDSIFARGDSPWPPVDGFEPPGGRLIHPDATSSHGIDGIPTFLMTNHLPEALLADLPAGVAPLTPEERSARDRRAGGHFLEVSPVRRSGPFVEVRWEWTAYERRAPDEAPLGYAGGGSLTLMETEEGWSVVGWGAWIT